jgi:hypothetical protein
VAAELIMPRKIAFYDSRFWIALGTIGWWGIVILSLVPGNTRPHSGMSGIYEHFFAYLMVGGAFGLGLPTLLHRLLIAGGLTVTAAVLEVAQVTIPGRTGEISGVVSGLAGAWIAVGIVSLKKSLEKNRHG